MPPKYSDGPLVLVLVSRIKCDPLDDTSFILSQCINSCVAGAKLNKIKRLISSYTMTGIDLVIISPNSGPRCRSGFLVNIRILLTFRLNIMIINHINRTYLART